MSKSNCFKFCYLTCSFPSRPLSQWRQFFWILSRIITCLDLMWIEISKACIALSNAWNCFVCVVATYWYDVHFSLHRESHLLPRIECNCEMVLFHELIPKFINWMWLNDFPLSLYQFLCYKSKNCEAGGVDDLRLDGGLPPSFQRANPLYLPKLAVIFTFMMNLDKKLSIFYHFLPISGKPTHI